MNLYHLIQSLNFFIFSKIDGSSEYLILNGLCVGGKEDAYEALLAEASIPDCYLGAYQESCQMALG